MAQVDEWTIQRLLGWTTQFLKDRAAESPRLDAEVLLAHARGCKRIDLYTSFAEVPPGDVRARFRELVRRRAEGMPVAYLVGYREFYSMPFRVTSDVLIPRPETELLLVQLLDLMRAGKPAAEGPAVRVADVGTGSGVLAVCATRHFAGCRVTAVDLSPKALAVARENAAVHGVADRVEWVEGDLLASLPAEATFDFIVSNPPYVTESEWAKLPREIRDFEPRGALVAGTQGTEVIARLIPEAAGRLAPGGWLLTEISPMIEADVRRLVETDTRLALAPTIKDLAGLARVVQARRR